MGRSVFDLLQDLGAFALVLFRVGGVVLTGPVLGSAVVPVRVRAALAWTVAAVVFPLVGPTAPRDLLLGDVVKGGRRRRRDRANRPARSREQAGDRREPARVTHSSTRPGSG